MSVAPSVLKSLIEEYVKYEEEFKKFNETLKPQLTQLKEMKDKIKNYKIEIENKMINGDIEEFIFEDYKFIVVERKVKAKPTQEDFNNAVLDELKKSMKKDKAEEIVNKAIIEIQSGGEEKIKKMNIKKTKKQQKKQKTVKLNNTKKTKQ